MKYMTFDEVEHAPNGWVRGERYAIDWDTDAELKYKEPIGGIRVYENGTIEVRKSGYRDPDWRQLVRRTFGLNFVLTSELVGNVFYEPATGMRVRKNDIRDDLLLYDGELERVYPPSRYGHNTLRFVSEHAQPMTTDGIDVRVRNKAREEELKGRLKEYIALGETLIQVKGIERTFLSRGTRRILRGEQPMPTDMQAEETQNFCMQLAGNKPLINKEIINASRDRLCPRYLNVKEK